MESIYKYISQLANMQRRLIEKLAKDKAYSGTQGKIIHYLFVNSDKTVYQKDIEMVFGLRAATATELINTLEKMEVVKRVKSKKDARFKELILTKKADVFMHDVMHDMEVLEEQLTHNIDKNELENWVNTTCKLLGNLKGEKNEK